MRGKRSKGEKRAPFNICLHRKNIKIFMASRTPANVRCGINLWILYSYKLFKHRPISWNMSLLSVIRRNKNLFLFPLFSSLTNTQMLFYSEFYWVDFAKQTMLIYNVKILQFFSKHTLSKTPKIRIFTSNNLPDFSIRMLLRHTHIFSLGSTWLVITVSCNLINM